MSEWIAIETKRLKQQRRTVNITFGIIIIILLALSFLGLRQETELKEKDNQIQTMTEIIKKI